MSDTNIIGREGREELIRILEEYWKDSDGGSGFVTINPDAIQQKKSTDDFVLMGYEGRDIYVFRQNDARHINEMMKIESHLRSEGFLTFPCQSKTRAYLVVDNNSV